MLLEKTQSIVDETYIDRDIINSSFIGERILTENDLLELLNNGNIDKGKYKQLIIDNDLRDFFVSVWHDIIYLDCLDRIRVYTVMNQMNLQRNS